MSRKGSSPIDWVVGAVIFIMLVAFAFYYANYVASPPQPYESVLRNAAAEVADSVASNATWVLKKVPVIVSSASSAKWPLGIYFRLPPTAHPSTLSVIDSNGSAYRRLLKDGRIFWSAPLSSGKNYYYFLYSEDVNLTDYAYQSDIYLSAAAMNNSRISLNFSSAGIANFTFGGNETLFGSGISLGTSSLPSVSGNIAYAEANYSDGMSAKIYSEIPKVSVHSNHSIDVSVYLLTNFTDFYADNTTYSFSAGSYSGITDMVDVYNSSGMAFIGSGINFSVSNKGSYREILMHNVTQFEIYAHPGNYSYALGERDAYLSPPQVTLGISDEIRGVSQVRFSLVSSMPSDELKGEMGVRGIGFQLLFNETEDYAAIPSGRGVVVVRHPVSLLERFGNVSETYLGVAVWGEK